MERCKVRWNPGKWPYVTRCILDAGHLHEHEDKHGNKLVNLPGQEED